MQLNKHQIQADERVLFLYLEIEVLRYICISLLVEAIVLYLFNLFIDIENDPEAFSLSLMLE